MALFGRMMRTTVQQDDLRQMAKPFEIPKRILWEAGKRVAANNEMARLVLPYEKRRLYSPSTWSHPYVLFERPLERCI